MDNKINNFTANWNGKFSSDMDIKGQVLQELGVKDLSQLAAYYEKLLGSQLPNFQGEIPPSFCVATPQEAFRLSQPSYYDVYGQGLTTAQLASISIDPELLNLLTEETGLSSEQLMAILNQGVDLSASTALGGLGGLQGFISALMEQNLFFDDIQTPIDNILFPPIHLSPSSSYSDDNFAHVSFPQTAKLYSNDNYNNDTVSSSPSAHSSKILVSSSQEKDPVSLKQKSSSSEPTGSSSSHLKTTSNTSVQAAQYQAKLSAQNKGESLPQGKKQEIVSEGFDNEDLEMHVEAVMLESTQILDEVFQSSRVPSSVKEWENYFDHNLDKLLPPGMTFKQFWKSYTEQTSLSEIQLSSVSFKDAVIAGRKVEASKGGGFGQKKK